MAAPILHDKPITPRDAVIPYLMAGLNMMAPIIAAGSTNVLSPAVYGTALVLVLLGLPLSVYFRQRKTSRFFLYFFTTVPLIFIAWQLVRDHPGLQFDWSDPWSSLSARELSLRFEGLLQLFVLFAAGRSFQLLTSRDVLQTPLPGFATYFLLSVIMRSHDQDILGRQFVPLLCLVVLCLTSLYLLGQEQSAQWVSIHPPLRLQQRLLKYTAWLAVLLFPVIVLAGWYAQPFNAEALAYARAARTSTAPRWTGLLRGLFGGTQAGVQIRDSVEMGGTDWPGGKQTVMTVTLLENPTVTPLWRGASYALYEGGRWQREPESSHDSAGEAAGWALERSEEQSLYLYQLTIDPRGPRSDPGVVQAIREGQLDPQATGSRVTQLITVQAAMSGMAPVYGMMQPDTVTSSHPSFGRAGVTADGAIFLAMREPQAQISYQVDSLIKRPPMNLTLREEVALPRESRWRYLRMAGEPRVSETMDAEGPSRIKIRALADEILAEGGLTAQSDPLKIIQRFQQYLTTHYRYTLKPAPPRAGVDPIEDFLFTQKQGYCVYFAGAMTMLCRSVRIPARFVVGYAAGDQEESKPGEEGITYKVTAEQAHAWTEVFLPHYGWYTMDPTAGSTVTPTGLGRVWDTFGDWYASIRHAIGGWVAVIQRDARLRAYINLALGMLLLLVAGVIYWGRERPPSMPKRVLSDKQAERAVLAAYARMHRWLRLWGINKPDGTTAVEFERRFRELNPAMGALVGELSALYVQTRYGAGAVRDADARRAITLLHDLWRVARTERKRLRAALAETEMV